MKKYLLFASAVAFMFSVNAQDKSVAVYRDASGMATIDADQQQSVLIKHSTAPQEKVASTVLLGTSYNIFTVLGDRQNQVVYNPTINTVAFVHRQNNGGAGGSGIISFDYSTDGGATWTNNPFQTTPGLDGGTSNGNRYPNIGLYAPTADTSLAYVVQAGPSLANNGAGSNGWAKTFRASAKFDGTNLDETYISNSQHGALNDNNEWGAAGLYVNALNDAWYTSTNIQSSGNTADDVAGQYSRYFLTQGVFNSTNNNFDWTTDTIIPGWHTTMNFTSGNLTNVGGLSNMAWSPNGMVGYMVAMGADSNGTNNTMYRPYVMKTTDGGATWNNVMDYDFSTDPVLDCYIWPLNTNPTVKRPFFSSYDMVVDNAGELRIFAEIGSGFSDHPDSLNYTFSARQSNFLFEVKTNAGVWDVTFIDSILVDDFTWETVYNNAHYTRPQAARSQDGSKVFYTWIGSDPALSASREFPDVWAIGRDVSTNLFTPITNLSVGNNSNYLAAYQTIAVETIENGADKDYEIPIVYGTAAGGAGLTDALLPPQWNFIRGIGFNAADFTQNAQANPCTVSVAETVVNSGLSIYPNPTKGIVEIRLSDVSEFNYTVIDVVGNVIANNNVNGTKATIDLSNNAKGIYFVTVDSKNGSTTQKILLTK